MFEEMFSRIEEAETDVEYYKGILKGTWPNSIEILEKALQKAKDSFDKPTKNVV
jgi:hypothetical protein